MKFDFHVLFSGKYAQWISLSLIVVLSLLILVEYASLMFHPVENQSLPPVTKELQVTAKQNAFLDILNSSLFGVYISNNLSGVKKSMLNVTLVGILFANKVNDSQVIIRSANGEEKTYKLEDIIPGGVTIKRIMADGVLVDRHGILESLSLPKNELNFEPVAEPLKED